MKANAAACFAVVLLLCSQHAAAVPGPPLGCAGVFGEGGCAPYGQVIFWDGNPPPNNLFEYDSVVLDPSRAAVVCGTLSVADNVDYFRITVASTSTALIETLLADGVSCPGGPMSLTVYDASLTSIATNAGGGTGGCASLDGLSSPVLQNLAPGSYYIRVIQSVFDPAGTPPYALDIRLF